MTDMVTIPRREYEALCARLHDLEDILAAREAAAGSRVPHAVAVRIMDGDNPVRAWREYRGLSLRALAEAAGVSPSYLSEIETARKPGSVEAYKALAEALGTGIDALIVD